MFNPLENSFTAWLLRLQIIDRWALLKPRISENCASHTFDVAMITFSLAKISKENFGLDININEAVVAALYHEASEPAGLSDLPSPVKYANPALTTHIKLLEKCVERHLVEKSLPQQFQKHIRKLIIHNELPGEIADIVKMADIISMYLKSKSEFAIYNNNEFELVFKKLEAKTGELIQDNPALLQLSFSGELANIMNGYTSNSPQISTMVAIVAHQIALSGVHFHNRQYNAEHLATIALQRNQPNFITGKSTLCDDGQSVIEGAEAFVRYYCTFKSKTWGCTASAMMNFDKDKASFEKLHNASEEVKSFFQSQGRLCFEPLSAITDRE